MAILIVSNLTNYSRNDGLTPVFRTKTT